MSQVKFTVAAPAQGNKNYIPVSDLYARNFTDTNGEFQLELSIGHVRTVFDAEVRVPTNIFGGIAAHHYGYHAPRGEGHPAGAGASANGTPAKNQQAQAQAQASKLETSYFTFGGFDWNLSIVPLAKESAYGLRARALGS